MATILLRMCVRLFLISSLSVCLFIDGLRLTIADMQICYLFTDSFNLNENKKKVLITQWTYGAVCVCARHTIDLMVFKRFFISIQNPNRFDLTKFRWVDFFHVFGWPLFCYYYFDLINVQTDSKEKLQKNQK